MVYNFTVWLRSETSVTGSRQQWKEQWYISRTPPAQHPPARTQLATGWWTQPGISAKVPDSCRVKPSTHVKASCLTNPGVVFPSQPIRAGACDYCRVIWHGTKCRSYISGFFVSFRHVRKGYYSEKHFLVQFQLQGCHCCACNNKWCVLYAVAKQSPLIEWAPSVRIESYSFINSWYANLNPEGKQQNPSCLDNDVELLLGNICLCNCFFFLCCPSQFNAVGLDAD